MIFYIDISVVIRLCLVCLLFYGIYLFFKKSIIIIYKVLVSIYKAIRNILVYIYEKQQNTNSN